ncbi:MAG TPA: hypothetical protein DD435_10780 [Cyanobacteria bacterium UBA8530]|nr:hypothetical protein [Cyanobacteria bacterium UBA8530]
MEEKVFVAEVVQAGEVPASIQQGNQESPEAAQSKRLPRFLLFLLIPLGLLFLLKLLVVGFFLAVAGITSYLVFRLASLLRKWGK